MLHQTIAGLHLVASTWPLDRHRPTLVCLHGAGGDTSTWLPVLPHLADAANVVVVDLPGHGASAGPLPRSIRDHAAAIADLVVALRVGPVVACGLSMGGAVVQQLMFDHPLTVAAAVLVSTSAHLRVAPAIFDAIDQDFTAFVDALPDVAAAPHTDHQRLAAVLAAMRAAGPATTATDFHACDRFDLRARLGELDRPTLVISAAHDRMTPIHHAAHLREHIPGARQVHLDDAGHLCTVERPDVVAGVIRGFVERLGRG